MRRKRKAIQPPPLRYYRTLLILATATLVGALWLTAIPSPRSESDLSSLEHPAQKLDMASTSATTTATTNNKPVLYSVARSDRSGSLIHDMLLAHAHAFHNNQTYGGACNGGSSGGTTTKLLHHQDAAKDLLESLGLQQILPFACPTKEDMMENPNRKGPKPRLVPNKVYRPAGTSAFTPEWRAYLQQQRIMETGGADSQWKNDTNSLLFVVVHIRRNDVVPCRGMRERYTPNSFYQSALRRSVFAKQPLATTNIVVKIHSETQSFEPWNRSIAYWAPDASNNHVSVELALDRPLREVWGDMMGANVLFLSKSSFSLVPAVLNFDARQIVYIPFWHAPMEGWTVVADELLDQTWKP